MPRLEHLERSERDKRWSLIFRWRIDRTAPSHSPCQVQTLPRRGEEFEDFWWDQRSIPFPLSPFLTWRVLLQWRFFAFVLLTIGFPSLPLVFRSPVMNRCHCVFDGAISQSSPTPLHSSHLGHCSDEVVSIGHLCCIEDLVFSHLHSVGDILTEEIRWSVIDRFSVWPTV